MYNTHIHIYIIIINLFIDSYIKSIFFSCIIDGCNTKNHYPTTSIYITVCCKRFGFVVGLFKSPLQAYYKKISFSLQTTIKILIFNKLIYL